MNKLLPILAGTFLCSLSAMAQGLSAWLPAKGQFSVTPAYSYQRFDEFWVGTEKVTTKDASGGVDDPQEQHNALLSLEYGITDTLALDATLGYAWVSSPLAPGGHGTDDGLIDTTIGARWQFLDEHALNCPLLPTLTLRVGGIIEGTYDQNTAFSVGDGASGFETSLLFAKEVCSGFGLYGDVGWRVRNHDVPQDFFGSFGAYATYKSFTLSAGYRHVQGLSGSNIGDPGFSFPEVREIQGNVEAALGYADKGGRYYQIFYAHTVVGRNTGEKDVFGAAITLPFGGH